MRGILINVASSSQDPNGRGHIFEDGSFEYLPIPECKETVENVPTYREFCIRLWRGSSYCLLKVSQKKNLKARRTNGASKRGSASTAQCLKYA